MKKRITLFFLFSGVLLLNAQITSKIAPVIQYNTESSTKAGTNASKFNPNHVYGTTCDTLNWPIDANWLPPVYYIAGTLADGFVNGPNLYADKEKAQFFDASASPFTKLHGFFLQFGHAYSANQAKIVTFRVYDGTGPNPGAWTGRRVRAGS